MPLGDDPFDDEDEDEDKDIEIFEEDPTPRGDDPFGEDDPITDSTTANPATGVAAAPVGGVLASLAAMLLGRKKRKDSDK